MTAPITTGQIYWGAVPFVALQVLMIGLTITFPIMVTHYQTKSMIDPADVKIDIAPPPPGETGGGPNFGTPAK
jgi:hypothetical protein